MARIAVSNLAEISRRGLADLSVPLSASITNVKQLSSYNWIETATPTIAVPGSPPVWSAPKYPQKLNQDTGRCYVAQNAARHPDSPIEPLFRALYITNPSFDIRSVDIVTDRNSIRKLFSFVYPSSWKAKPKSFTINVEIIKQTVIFLRHEAVTSTFIQPHHPAGFGHEFEKAYTTNQISGSTGHYSIISHRLSDLNFIVCHEVDGYVNGDTEMPSSNSTDIGDDGLSSMLGSLASSRNMDPPSATPPGSKLTIKEEGQLVPLESNLEIKTCGYHKTFERQKILPQLWISQTSKLVRAYHSDGIFNRPEVVDMAPLIKEWEEQSQMYLRKLAGLIRKILDVIRGYGGNAVIKYDDKKDELVVMKNHGPKLLPKDLYSKWDEGRDPEKETTVEHDTGTENPVKPVDKEEINPEEKSVVVDSMVTKGKEAEKIE